MQYNSAMKIREKIFLGFTLYVVLAAILGFFSYQELKTITIRLGLVEMADDITSSLLEVRRYEKVFLLSPDKDNRRQLAQYLTILRKDVDDIKEEIIHEIGRQNHDMMRSAIREYEILFDWAATTILSRQELIEAIRTSGRKIENALSDDALEAFLEVRKEEKNLMLFENPASVEAFNEKLLAKPLANRPEIREYKRMVGKLSRLYTREHKSIKDMRGKAREIQQFTENLSKRERETIENTIKRSVRILIVALIVVIGLGSFINLLLARRIGKPLIRLEAATRKVAAGDFTEILPIRGNDEIASLQRSFNSMQEKLGTALKSLEDSITQLREKQVQLVEAEKLAAVGILAAGIAHEINNPLTSVLTFSNLMLEKMTPDNPDYERLRMMVRETARARHIVRQLLNFARETPLKKIDIDVNEPVREIIDSLKAQGLFGNISLSLDLADNLPTVSVDPVRIGQVVMNIMMNAVHSINPPGKIEVVTRRTGSFVEVAVTDSGEGIQAEHLGRIFDPFFTTKTQDKGTGLGLAVSYGIMKKHDGDIIVSSVPGKGSTFTMRIPVHEET